MMGLNYCATAAGFLLILSQGCLLRLAHAQALPPNKALFWGSFPEEANDAGSKMSLTKAKATEEKGDYNNNNDYYHHTLNNNNNNNDHPRPDYPLKDHTQNFYASPTPQHAAPAPLEKEKKRRTLDRLGSGLMMMKKRPLDHLGQGLLKKKKKKRAPHHHQDPSQEAFPGDEAQDDDESAREGTTKREAVQLIKKGLDVLGRGLLMKKKKKTRSDDDNNNDNDNNDNNDDLNLDLNLDMDMGSAPGNSELRSALEETFRGLGNDDEDKDVDAELVLRGLDLLTSAMVKRGLDTAGVGLVKKSLDALAMMTEAGAPGNRNSRPASSSSSSFPSSSSSSSSSPHGDPVDLLRKGLDRLQTTLAKAGWDQDAVRMISEGAVRLASWIAARRRSGSGPQHWEAAAAPAPSKKALDRLGTGLMKKKKDAGLQSPFPGKHEEEEEQEEQEEEKEDKDAPRVDKDAKSKASANEEELRKKKKEKFDRFLADNKHKYAQFLTDRDTDHHAPANNDHMYADLKAAFDDGHHHQKTALGTSDKSSKNVRRDSREGGESSFDFKATQTKRGFDQVGMGLMKKSGLDQVGMGLMKKNGLDQVGMGLMKKKELDQVGMGLMKKGLDQVGMGLMKKGLDEVEMGLMKKGLDEVGMGLMKKGLDQVGMGLMKKKGLDQLGTGLMKKRFDEVGSGLMMKKGLDQVGMGLMKKGLDEVGMGLMKKKELDQVGMGLMKKKGLDQVGMGLMKKKGLDDEGPGIYKKDLDYVGVGIMKKDVHGPSAAQFRAKQQRQFKSHGTPRRARWPEEEEPLSHADAIKKEKDYFDEKSRLFKQQYSDKVGDAKLF